MTIKRVVITGAIAIATLIGGATTSNAQTDIKLGKDVGYSTTSIVNYLSVTGQDTDYAYREQLAEEIGFHNYKGTEEQNKKLIKALKGVEIEIAEPKQEVASETVVQVASTEEAKIETKAKVVEEAEVVEEVEVPSTDVAYTMTVEATQYTATCKGCSGITRYGTDVRNTNYHPSGHRIVATDPNVIAPGTIIRINGETFIADDIGSAIKSNKIDILVSTREEALAFGRQTIEIEILK